MKNGYGLINISIWFMYVEYNQLSVERVYWGQRVRMAWQAC